MVQDNDVPPGKAESILKRETALKKNLRGGSGRCEDTRQTGRVVFVGLLQSLKVTGDLLPGTIFARFF